MWHYLRRGFISRNPLTYKDLFTTCVSLLVSVARTSRQVPKAWHYFAISNDHSGGNGLIGARIDQDKGSGIAIATVGVVNEGGGGAD